MVAALRELGQGGSVWFGLLDQGRREEGGGREEGGWAAGDSDQKADLSFSFPFFFPIF